MEFWDIYDKNGRLTGRQVQKNATLQHGEYHLAVEVWIINSKKQILLQQRSKNCELLPGVWGLTTGRVKSKEDSLQGCLREVQEELGLHLSSKDMTRIRRIVREDKTHLIWDVYAVYQDIDNKKLRLQKNEVDKVRWVTPAEFKDMLKRGVLFRYPEIEDLLHEILNKNT